MEHLYQQFGSFSALYIKVKDFDNIMSSSIADSTPPNRTVIDEPQFLIVVDHEYEYKKCRASIPTSVSY